MKGDRGKNRHTRSWTRPFIVRFVVSFQVYRVCQVQRVQPAHQANEVIVVSLVLPALLVKRENP